MQSCVSSCQCRQTFKTYLLVILTGGDLQGPNLCWAVFLGFDAFSEIDSKVPKLHHR